LVALYSGMEKDRGVFQALWPLIWRYGSMMLLLGALSACAGRISPPQARAPGPPTPSVQYGIASWYGEPFHGRRMANGEVYDMFESTAAHVTAPLGIQAVVTNLENGRSVRLRITDRGPYVGDRILDLSYGAAHQLRMVEAGLARVRLEFLPGTAPVPAFIVQAGAYTDPDKALRVQKVLAPQYPQVWVVEVREGSAIFYRVRLGTFSSRADAEQVARQVAVLGYAASVIPLASSAAVPRQSGQQF